MEQKPIKAQDVADEAGDLLVEIGKWFALVLAVAVGTCLGLILFVYVSMHVMEKELQDFRLPTSTSSSR